MGRLATGSQPAQTVPEAVCRDRPVLQQARRSLPGPDASVSQIHSAGKFSLRKLVIKPCLACTANCPTCACRRELHKDLRREPMLTLQDWSRILTEARELGVERLDISGGEPTLYKYLTNLIQIGRGYGWHVGVNTNGSLIDQAYAESLLRAGVNTICVSLYSPNPAVHDAMRRSRNLWHKATNAIRILRAMERRFPDFRVVTQTILCRENHESFADLLELHYRLGSHSLGIAYLEGDFDRQYLLNEDEIRHFRKYVIPKVMEFTDRLSSGARKHARRTLHEMFSEDILTISEWASGYYRPRHKNLPPCRRPMEFAIILANGDVHPCNMVEYTHEPVMGNVYVHSLTEVWNSEKWNTFRVNLFDGCTSCPINLYMGISL